MKKENVRAGIKILTEIDWSKETAMDRDFDYHKWLEEDTQKKIG